MKDLAGEFTLVFSRTGDVTISRGGYSQTVTDTHLRSAGWNAIAGAARMIQAKESGKYQ